MFEKKRSYTQKDLQNTKMNLWFVELV